MHILRKQTGTAGRMRPVPVLLTGLLLATAGCHVLKIEKPAETYLAPSWSPRYSQISIPVETNAKTLKKLVNRYLTGVIYNDTSFANNNQDNLMLRATRSDSIDISVSGNELSYRVPLKIWIRKRFSAGLLGYNFSKTGEANAEVALKFRTHISLNKDWTVNAVTTSDGYEWISYPQVMVGMMKIPLPVISDLLVNSNMPTITKEIDKSIKESFNLQSMMSEAWTGMQKPFKVSDEYSLWLKLTPLEVSSVPIRANASVFHHTVGIRTLIELYFGDEPAYEVNKKLPPLKITSAIPEELTVNFSIDIPFTKINEMAGKQLNGHVFSYRNYTIIVREIGIYGQEDNLVAALKVDGSIKGTIYLSGRPVFRKDSCTLELENLDFSVSTKNALVRTASWLFHSGLVQKLAANLVFPVGDRLGEAKNELSSWLAKNQEMGDFRIAGSIDRLDPDRILITRGSVKACFRLEGKIGVRVE